MSVLKLENVCYSYNKKNQVLSDINYEFEKGKVYGIIGKSGAGKTTLLSLLSGLTTPEKGRILFDGNDIRKINKYTYRSSLVGVVFQSYNLLPTLTAKENVVLSMDITPNKMGNKNERAVELLKQMDLTDEEIDRRILKLSGGQQQRVAIARSLGYGPQIILADEPTGNLDVASQEEIMHIFQRLAHEEDKCVIIVTHSPEVSKAVDALYSLSPLK